MKTTNFYSLTIKIMGSYEVLPFKDVFELFGILEKGKKAEVSLKEQDPLRPLTDEEKETLEIEQSRGLQAKDKIILHNGKLVLFIAKRYLGFGLSFEDLAQEGELGLMTAVDKFDRYRGTQFSTYATWWIRQAITRALGDSGTIRLPIHLGEKIRRIHKIEEKLREKLGRKPTIEELSAETGLTSRKIIIMFKSSQKPVSLEKPVGEDEDSDLGSLLPDKEADPPERATIKTDQDEKIVEILSHLEPREERIIKLRFGLFGETALTLEQTGKRYRLTRERVRQIEKNGLEKLKALYPQSILEQILSPVN